MFSGQELSPRVEEGAALLAGDMSVKVKTVDVSSWLLDKYRAWTPAARELVHSIQQQSFDLVFVTLPAKGTSRALFANKQGPAPLRNKRYPYGFPWLSQHAKRVNDSITVDTAFLLTLSFAAMTQNNTGPVLFASEERGQAHFGEPCSWCQTEDVQHLAELGANRGALYSCELVHKWTEQRSVKAGSLGFMVDFCAKAKEVKEGWPNIKSPEQTYEGPLSKHCGCGHSHQLLSLPKAKETNISPSVCAHFLQSLPRLPEGRGQLNTLKLRGNGAYFFSPLFRLRQSRSLLAAAATVLASPMESLAGVKTSACQFICCERDVHNEREVQEKANGWKEDRGICGFNSC